VKDEFARRAAPRSSTGGSDIEDEDLIQREDMVVTVSHGGYIKRVPLSTYRAQRRGGKGRSGMRPRRGFRHPAVRRQHAYAGAVLLLARQVYKEKVWRLPIGTPSRAARRSINMLPLEQGERITTIMPLPDDESSWDALDVMFATTRRQRAPQQAVRLRRCTPQRQDRDEARGGRRPSSTCRPAPRMTTCC
jgi:DNA gyrase subunit A